MAWTLRLTLLAAVVTAATTTCPSSEWKQHDSMCYWRSNYTLTWSDARQICPALFPGSGMVSIHDSELNAFIAEDVANGDQAWIGLLRVGDTSPWVWFDGSAYDYSNWFDNDPEWCFYNCCAYINYINEGVWTGLDCYSYYRLFMCQIAASWTMASANGTDRQYLI